MKKFNIFLITLLLLPYLFSLYSCKQEEIRLLESITYNNGSYVKYEYDDQNRITKIDKSGKLSEERSFIYNGNDLVNDGHLEYEKISYKDLKDNYYYNGDNFVVTSEEKAKLLMQQKKNGDIIKDKYATYYRHLSTNGNLIRVDGYTIYGLPIVPSKYIYNENGNLIQKTSNNDDITKYEYDNKKAPFIHCNTSKWWLQYENFGTKNNIIKIKENGKVTRDYVYEYDNARYPIKCTEYIGCEEKEIRVYKYKIISSISSNNFNK